MESRNSPMRRQTSTKSGISTSLLLQTPTRDNRRRLLSPASALRSPGGARTPSSAAAFMSPSSLKTPSARESRLFNAELSNQLSPQPTRVFRGSPPAAPRPPQSKLSADIDEAVNLGSLSQLALVLQGNQHATSHMVHEAVKKQSLAALEFLLSSGFPADDCWQGRRPLHLAEQYCLMDGDVGHRMMQLLLRYGARTDRVPGDDPMKESPLHSAAQRCSIAAVAMLLASGADPNQADLRGDTPMHAACRMACSAGFTMGTGPHRTPQHSVLSLLLKHGACPLSKDAVGLPPMMFASKYDNQVRAMLAQAERWWNRHPLTLINAQLCRNPTALSAHDEGLAACLGQAGLSKHIATFL